jgi:hypothetical protein
MAKVRDWEMIVSGELEPETKERIPRMSNRRWDDDND